MNFIVSEELRTTCPEYVGAAIEAEVTNWETAAALWQEIETVTQALRQAYTTESLKRMAPIAATRTAYKRCGKDPSRYRPSGEQLVRRVLQGKELYRINTLVDLINLASIESGYSIGGFDADCIQNDTLTLGIGREGEPYEGIGRGTLNIAGMPVWRDTAGGVGTPTSDNERTKITDNTRHLVTIVNGYDGDAVRVADTAERIRRLLRKYAGSDGGICRIFR